MDYLTFKKNFSSHYMFFGSANNISDIIIENSTAAAYSLLILLESIFQLIFAVLITLWIIIQMAFSALMLITCNPMMACSLDKETFTSAWENFKMAGETLGKFLQVLFSSVFGFFTRIICHVAFSEDHDNEIEGEVATP